MDDDDLSRRNASVRTDDVPLPPDLRARLLADAADVARPIPKIRWRPFAWFGGLADLSAALAGLQLGLAQPALILGLLPGATDAATLDAVFGSAPDAAGWQGLAGGIEAAQ